MTRKNRGWIWFFVVLAGLSVAAIASLIVYNVSQQLKPERLAEARRLWREKGMRNYRLLYRIRRGRNLEEDTYVVVVRNGVVVSSTFNGTPEPRRLFGSRDMAALFDNIGRFLEMDAKPGQPRTYTVASFDERDGALHKYVRRVMGKDERTEIIVDSLEALEDS